MLGVASCRRKTMSQSYTCLEWRHSRWLREGQLHAETSDVAIIWRRVVYIDTVQ
jgi:hypothetical protein